MSEKKQIPLFKVFMADEVDKPLLDVLHSGYIGEGPQVSMFEQELRDCFGNPFLTTLNNGTAGLHLAYHMALHQDGPKSWFNSNDAHSCFIDSYDAKLPGVASFNKTHSCVPVGWWVTKEDRERIANLIIKFAE